ncbi:MAG: hypothetical protein ACI4W6_05485, partial [Acutalibacteraceae bacterium]
PNKFSVDDEDITEKNEAPKTKVLGALEVRLVLNRDITICAFPAPRPSSFYQINYSIKALFFEGVLPNQYFRNLFLN